MAAVPDHRPADRIGVVSHPDLYHARSDEGPMITVCSIMRNSMNYMHRYFGQIRMLEDVLPEVRVVIGEGDHMDSTDALLRMQYGRDAKIIDVSHGGPRFGSVDEPERWNQIAGCVRATLDAVGDPGKALIWVESDLIWNADTMLKLVGDLEQRTAVAPMVYRDGTNIFYDVWGFRRAGKQFTAEAPYFVGGPTSEFIKIDSCGSCFAISPDGFGFLDRWSGHWPFQAGGTLWLDTTVEVTHVV